MTEQCSIAPSSSARRVAANIATLPDLLKRKSPVEFIPVVYSVVAKDADPYLELDTPVYFRDHRAALLYAIEIAVACRSTRDARMTISISAPNDEPHTWSIGGLLAVRRWTMA
jgi:hypothetical protein